VAGGNWKFELAALFLAGGVPLKVNGVSVAGIGVGGAPDGMLDEACATAGADAIAGTAKSAGMRRVYISAANAKKTTRMRTADII